MTDHRWQGYGHAELYAKIHEGPGPGGSEQSMSRWRELIAALDEIDGDLHTTLDGSTHTWEGAAADQARTGLSPLRAWAAQAKDEAETMRLSAELQAGYIAKARNDMPPPGVVTAAEPSTVDRVLTHLFGGQTDYETQEAAANAAEQKAFDVMSEYQASTEANTATLGQFTPPPEVIVSTPITPAPGRRIIGPEPDEGALRSIRGGTEPESPSRRATTGKPLRRTATTPRPSTEPEPGQSTAKSSTTPDRLAARPTVPEPTAAATPTEPAPIASATPGPAAPAHPLSPVDEHAELLLEREDVFGEQHTIAPPVLGEVP